MTQARVFAFAIDVQAGFFRFEILITNLDQGVLLDVVADFLALFDLFREPRQTFSVDGVGRIEILHVGLVKIGERHGFKLQAILQQVFFHRFAHLFDERAAFFV